MKAGRLTWILEKKRGILEKKRGIAEKRGDAAL
jgi:hypothetical protein